MALILGVNENVPNKEYHADRTYLSSSVLKVILEDLAEYKRQYIDGGARTAPSNQAALDEGSYAHSMILEPHLLDKDYAIFPGPIKKGKEWDAFKENVSPHVTIISAPQKARLNSLLKAYEVRAEAVELMQGTKVEHTLCVELDGVRIKVRADAIKPGTIIDIKTTGYPGSADQFKQTVQQLNYQLSGALYSMAYEQHFGQPFDFYFIVLSKRDYNCEIYKLGKDSMAQGRSMVKEALRKYKKALDSGLWIEHTEEVENKEETGVGKYEIVEV